MGNCCLAELRDSYAATGRCILRSAGHGGAGRKGADFSAGFGDRSTKALAVQKQRDRLNSQNNPEGFFCSGRLGIRP